MNKKLCKLHYLLNKCMAVLKNDSKYDPPDFSLTHKGYFTNLETLGIRGQIIFHHFPLFKGY